MNERAAFMFFVVLNGVEKSCVGPHSTGGFWGHQCTTVQPVVPFDMRLHRLDEMLLYGSLAGHAPQWVWCSLSWVRGARTG